MPPMIAASAISPRNADAAPATRRMMTSGFTTARMKSATFERSLVTARSLGPYAWRRSATSALDRPALEVRRRANNSAIVSCSAPRGTTAARRRRRLAGISASAPLRRRGA